MKILNIILSVLVLLAAAASAVFSYFLYEKRVALSGGWDKLVEATGVNAKAIDHQSGTAAAKELTAEKLAIKDYSPDKMDSALGKSKKLVRDLVAQRDALAEKLAEIGAKFSAGVQLDDIKVIATSGEQADKVVKAVDSAIRARDRVYSELRRLTGADTTKLKKGDVSGLDPVRKIVNDEKSSRQALGNIASRVGASGNEGSTVYQAVDRKVREGETARSQLGQKEQEILRYKNAVADRERQIAAVKRVVEERDEEIRSLKKALGLDPKVEFVIWKKGSEEARVRLQGKVTEVSSDYGYIVIDLGAQSVVKQPAGKKNLEINLGLQSGVELAVMRDDELIAMITLDKVGEKESTANIPLEKVGKIKVGDRVVYKGLKK